MSLEKISFNGKEISVCRAKTIYNLMKLGIYSPEMDKQERWKYVEWFEKNRDKEQVNLKTGGKPFMVPVDERGYLIMNLRLNLITKGFIKSMEEYDKKYGDFGKEDSDKKIFNPFKSQE